MPSAGCEFLDAAIHGIGDVQIVLTIRDDAVRQMELTGISSVKAIQLSVHRS